MLNFAKCVTNGVIPLGGVICRDKLYDAMMKTEAPEHVVEFFHGYTYSGHPVGCAVAVANVQAMRAEGVIERVAQDLAPYLATAFGTLADHPLVGDVQSLGMVAGLVLYKDKASRTLFDAELGVGYRCRDHCFQNGVVMRAVEERMIIAPPLVMTHQDIDEMVRRIRRSLDDTLAGLGAEGLI